MTPISLPNRLCLGRISIGPPAPRAATPPGPCLRGLPPRQFFPFLSFLVIMGMKKKKPARPPGEREGSGADQDSGAEASIHHCVRGICGIDIADGGAAGWVACHDGRLCFVAAAGAGGEIIPVRLIQNIADFVGIQDVDAVGRAVTVAGALTRLARITQGRESQLEARGFGMPVSRRGSRRSTPPQQ